jgi:hypothetical protein
MGQVIELLTPVEIRSSLVLMSQLIGAVDPLLWIQVQMLQPVIQHNACIALVWFVLKAD